MAIISIPVNTLWNRLNKAASTSSTALFAIITGCYAPYLGLLAILAIPFGDIVTASCQWDCYWYLDISRNGYSSFPLIVKNAIGVANWAFFPLYPLLVREASGITGISVENMAFLLNALGFPVVIFMAVKTLIKRDLTREPIACILIFLLFPFNVWYTAQYSECIYALIILVYTSAIHKNQISTAAFSSFCLALTRPTGLIVSIAGSVWQIFFSRKEILSSRFANAILIIGCAGFAVSIFALHLHHVMGDGLAFAHVQIAWKRHSSIIFVHIIRFMTKLHRIPFLIYFIMSCFLLKEMARDAKWRLEFIILLSTLLISVTTSLISIERIIFGNPLAIQYIATRLTDRFKNRLPRLLIILAIIHTLGTLAWYCGYRVLL